MTFLTKVVRIAATVTLAMPLALSAAQAETTLTIGVKSDRYSVKEDKFTFTTRRPSAQIAEPAVRTDANVNPSPLLFRDWTYAEGLYTVTLQEGVAFSDGTPWDAESAIAGPRCSCRQTIRRKNPIGTGPFLLESHEPKQQITVVRNPDYWGEAPNVDKMTFRFITDDNVRMLALQNGEIDVIDEVTPQMMLSMPKDGSVVLHESRPIRYAALMFNMQGKAPFDIASDVKLRKALAQVLWDGRGRPVKTILPGWMFDIGDDHAQGFTYELSQANALLDEAGWTMGTDGVREKDGRKLALRMVSADPNVSTVKPMPEMLDQIFAAIGVEIENIEIEDSGVSYDNFFKTDEADIYLEYASNNNTDPTYLLYNVFTTMSPWGYAVTSPGGKVDELAAAPRVAKSREEAVDLARQAYRAIVDDHVSANPVLTVPNFVLSRPGITVPMSEYADWIDYGNATIAD